MPIRKLDLTMMVTNLYYEFT